MTEPQHVKWPKHPDGRSKKYGEMTAEQQRAQIKAVCERLKKDKSFIAALNAMVHDDGSA